MTKRYGRRWVLRGLDLAVTDGEVAWVAGANGSGKSTLLRVLAGLTRPTAGLVTGRPSVVGYVPDRLRGLERTSALGYLTHFGRIRGLRSADARERAGSLLERLDLTGGVDAPLGTLSAGNVQKVAVAQALLRRPSLLVLDEPWTALDSAAREVLDTLVAETADAGSAVVMSRHVPTAGLGCACTRYELSGGVLTGSPLVGSESLAEITIAGRPDATWRWTRDRDVVRVLQDGEDTAVEVGDASLERLLRAALDEGVRLRAVRRRSNAACLDAGNES